MTRLRFSSLNLIYSAICIATAITVTAAASPSLAQVALNAQQFCSSRHNNSVGRITYGPRGPRVTCQVPGSTGFNGGPVHYGAAEACQQLTGDSRIIVQSGVFCRTNPNRLSSLLGTWRLMSGIYIVNRHNCGGVRYFSTITVTRQVGPNAWVGINRFRWDTSRLARGCFFRKPRSGTVRIRMIRRGNMVIVQYSQNGVHRFATDRLMLTESLRAAIMQGRDQAGQWVAYRKIS